MTARPSPRGDGAVGCGDTPAPLFDVAALSVGLPDGVYFAGRQLEPWLTFDEHREIANMWVTRTVGRPSDEQASRMAELLRRRLQQSAVVRWEVEEGRPAAPEAMRTPYSYGSADEERAFTWCSGLVFDSDLVHALVADVQRSRDSNRYYDAAKKVLEPISAGWALGETWVLPRRVLERVVAEQELVEARERLAEAGAAARAVGAEVDPRPPDLGDVPLAALADELVMRLAAAGAAIRSVELGRDPWDGHEETVYLAPVAPATGPWMVEPLRDEFDSIGEALERAAARLQEVG